MIVICSSGFVLFLAAPSGMQDLSSLTWDQTHVRWSPSTVCFVFSPNFKLFILYWGVADNNVVMVSGEQRAEVLSHTDRCIQAPLPARLAHNSEQSSMCYPIDSRERERERERERVCVCVLNSICMTTKSVKV